MNKSRGISLIVLVITIIVIIILAGAVILSLANNNPISQANEAKYKANMDAYKSELSMTLGKLYVDSPNLDMKTVNKPAWSGSGTTVGTVKDYIPSMSDEDAKKYVVQEGKLRYKGNDIQELALAQSLDITGYVNEFNYSGNAQTFTVPVTGTYKLQVWGASGGGNNPNDATIGSRGGKGGFSEGKFYATAGTNLYIFVGGTTTTLTGGYNGGGNSDSSGLGGGGATDIRTVSGTWNNAASLNSRIIVAGGGGGSDDTSGTFAGLPGQHNDGTGGDGGGLTGGIGYISGVTNNAQCAQGATQTTGSAFGYAVASITGADYGGGGGGYYGGYPSTNMNGGGGGGSGYIGGVTNGQTSAGLNVGNGYARISQIQ